VELRAPGTNKSIFLLEMEESFQREKSAHYISSRRQKRSVQTSGPLRSMYLLRVCKSLLSVGN